MHVVLVHGYLAPGGLLWVLARRLRKAGFDAELFDYPSHRGTLFNHAAELAARLRSFDPELPLAVVGHSLGGLVAHEAVAMVPTDRVVRRVFIATPHRGAELARRAIALPIGRLLSPVSRAAAQGVATRAHPARTGVVIGTRDRMVQPSEADLAAADDRIRLPYGHNEILFRPQTAEVIARFLSTGWFEPRSGSETTT